MQNDNKSGVDLDLDALAPAKIQINFNGKTIQVPPPSLEQYVKVIDFAEQMSSIENKQDNYKQVAEVYKEINDFIYECIPDLKDQPLNVAQVTAIFELLSKMGSPSDKAISELKSRGIDVKAGNSDPKGSTS